MKQLEWLNWHEDKQCLEITLEGWSLVIEGINLEFAQTLADNLGLHLIQKRSIYTAPDVAPQVTQSQRNVSIEVWKYPKHPDNR